MVEITTTMDQIDFRLYIYSLWFYPLIMFWIVASIQLFYYLFFYSRITIYKKKEDKDKDVPLSVIICARNESGNLSDNLPSILNQKHSNFEVIVVNDASNDDTEDVLYNLRKKHSKLKFTSIFDNKDFSHGKKLAVTVGIKAAKNEHLVFTDADCKPSSDLWLQKIQKHFSEEKSIVLGYGAYRKEKGLLNNFIRHETFFTGMQYLSFALAGIPYMGVGRNMAYKKELFFRHKGFSSHYHLLSGDDDLFVNEAATKKNAAVEIDHQSITYSEAKKTLSGWFKQKRRHYSTSSLYKTRHKFLLTLEPATRIIYYALFIILLTSATHLFYVACTFLLRLIIQLIVLKISLKRLNEKYLLLPSLIYDILAPVFLLVPMLINRISGRKSSWK
jgi:cellulose synthase/poly-beta-1,6-N-acetylglucosamine synthase-like glycosyltransferase